MSNSNPAFSRTPAFQPGRSNVATPSAETLEGMYQSPTAGSLDTGRMTVEDTLVKTVVSFVLLLAGAAVGWVFTPVLLPALIIGFALAMVNIFKRTPSAPLVLLYAVFEGAFIGALSRFFENMFPGVVIQAVLATAAVVAVTLILFVSGKVRASARATKVFMIALIGYVVYSLVNVILMMTGVLGSSAAFGLDSVKVFGIPIGLLIGVLVVIIGGYSLVLDFESIKQGVANRAPRVFGWRGAFGIMVTVVFLYVQLLRIFALSRN